MTTQHLEPDADAPAPSRRNILIGGAGLAAAAVVGDIATAGAAHAAYPAVNPYTRTRIPTRAELHMMNRMGCGYSRTTWAQMRAAGGVTGWFNRQLDHASVTESAKANELLGWFPALSHSPQTRWKNQTSGGRKNWQYARDLGNWTMLRRMWSNRQVHEMMVDFWSNHLHVPAIDDMAWVQRFAYDQTIRRHALGRFDQLLAAATLHPAMLLYLDNWRSVKDAPNENHGRELLELHTVGRASGYTEQMVKDSAKILSGHTVAVKGTWAGYYDSAKHTTGPVRVLDFDHPNGSADGRAVTTAYLTYLARHPATARTIARKLAVRFVKDNPTDALVNHLAEVYLSSGTDIRATLRALVSSTEFTSSFGQKVRTPVEDLVATHRALRITPTRPDSSSSYAHAIAYVHQGEPLFQWPRPDGPPDRNSAWASATRMLGSFRMHWNHAGGYYPRRSVVYRTPRSWLPKRRIRLDRYVDHVCRMVLGRGATPQLLYAVVQATGCKPATIITPKHAVARWQCTRVLAVLLDSPQHMSR